MNEPAPSSSPPPPAPASRRGLEPRPRLFLGLLVVFVGWIGLLVVLTAIG